MDISLSCWVNLICAKLKPRSGIQKAILSKSNFLKRKFIPTQYSILCGFNKGCTTIGRWSENNGNSHKIAIFGCFGRLPLFCVDFSRLWRFTDYLTTSSQNRIPLLLGVEKCIFEKFNFPHTTSPLDWWFLPFIFLGSLPAAQAAHKLFAIHTNTLTLYFILNIEWYSFQGQQIVPIQLHTFFQPLNQIGSKN